ncbi:MAG: hypothetical protein GY754_12675 [bacterium]|nr:hypothetical protein [bacterium]
MNNHKLAFIITITIFLFTAAAAITLPGCFINSDNDAVVSIDLGLNRAGSKAGTAPGGITGIIVRASGPGMQPIEGNYGGNTSAINLRVPAGKNRLIEVTAVMNPAIVSAVLTYKGSTTENLKPGEEKTVAIKMITNTTKLVIPDYLNSRIVQINNMEGGDTAINATWQELTKAELPYFASVGFSTGDIDFDASGRIYIASGGPSTGEARVVRLNNITDTTAEEVSVGGMNYYHAVTVDRANGYVYYTEGTNLYRRKTDLSTSEETFTLSAEGLSSQDIRGLAADQQGYVYLANANISASAIYKFNPSAASGSRIEASSVGKSYSSSLAASKDVLLKDGSLYVANKAGAAGYRLLQLSADLSTLVAAYGAVADSATDVGDFYGPQRFVGAINGKIYLIDEDTADTKTNRIIYMDDMSGSGWTTYGEYHASDTSAGYFQFFTTGGP